MNRERPVLELDLRLPSRPLLGILFLVLLTLGLGSLGRVVTPVEGGEPQLLSPERWHAQKLARQARAESEALYHDGVQLAELLDQERPDPVAAMLLAQAITARHRQGTPATTPARQALVAAAQVTAHYVSGAAEREEAAAALERALALLARLLEGAE